MMEIDFLSVVLTDAVTFLHPLPTNTHTNTRWAWVTNGFIRKTFYLMLGLTHERFGTHVFSHPCPQFEHLSEFLSGKCCPVCCLVEEADGMHFIVQSGIQIKVIGLFLMGLMGVEESMLAAWEAIWRWQEAYPMLSTHTYVKWLGLQLPGYRVWTRRVAQGRNALLYWGQQVL